MRKTPHPAFSGALLAALITGPLSAAPLITEFLASNSTGILDEDATRQDWIEIHNPDASPLDLSGYYLTDDSALPKRWAFPSGVTLAPGAYLVVFASGKDRAVAGQNLHTNFSLAAGGEYVGLYAPSGLAPAVSSFTFGQQIANVSYGLITPAAGSAEGFFTVPTPGAPNNAANAPAEPVRYSVTSRTFNQGASFNLALSTLSPTATIRYTTNRGKPLAVQGIMGTFASNATTDELTLASHGFSDRDEVQIQGTSVAGLGQARVYFVTLLGPNTIKLSEEPGGTPVDITGAANITLRRDAAYFTAATTGICTSSYHRFYDRDPVQVTSTGTLPGGLVAGTTYYVSITPATPVERNNYRLSATPGGAALPITSTGSGQHTISLQPSQIYSAPLAVSYSQRVRARAFETGRPDGPIGSESYIALDAAAQTFTSNIPVMILHSWGSQHPSTTAPGAGTPEDTKDAVWFVFEPKLETGVPVARLTNPPDLATPGYFERRGSSTFGELKYSMTMGALNESGTGKNVSPLGFASNDDFVLNAPYTFDRSLMHNDLIYRISNEAGRYAPKTRHVEVFMSVNNDVGAGGGNPAYGVVTGSAISADYYGVYSFQDKISRGNNRIDIEGLEPTDNTAPNVQGGYVFKIDRLDAGDSGVSGGGRSFALVQPKEWTSYPSHLQVATNQQKTYLGNTLTAMYNACLSPNFMDPVLGYQAHLDVPAAIDHWWLSILPKSADAFRLSGYWHKSRYGKLVMGPIFDFDRAMGSTDGRDLNPVTWRGDNGDLGTDYFHNAGIYSPNYFHYMFLDPNYWQSTIDRYEELRKGVLSTAHVHGIIDEWTELLDPGNSAVNTGLSTPAKRNFQRFTGTPARGASATTPGTNGTFRGEAQWLKNWWGKAGAVTANGRFDFVDGQFTRPATTSIPAGPVAPGSSVTLTSPSLATPGVKIYYTTNGTDPRAKATAPLTPGGGFTTIGTFLPEISRVYAIVPTSASTGAGPTAPNNTGTEWRGADLDGNGNNADDFDHSTWFTNTAGQINGVGYDNSTAVDYLPFISVRWNTTTFNPTSVPPVGISPVSASNVMFTSTISGTSYAGNQTCYIRIPFTLTPAQMALAVAGNRLVLQMHHDDGYVAWINGTELTNGRTNAPATAALTFNSAATTTTADATAITYVDYDITAQMSALHTGENVLAIQGLNSGLASSDFIMGAKIVIQSPPPPYTPELSASAIQYTGPINITVPTQLFVRTVNPIFPSDPPTSAGGGTGSVPNGSSWSGPTLLYYFPGADVASQANIKITEVHYHPVSPSADEISSGWTSSNDFEFIRLTNTGTAPVDLTGIYFSNGLEFTATPGLQNWLPAGSSVVVVENLAAFTSRYGNTFTILGQFSGELDDGGEHIVLNDKTGAVISDFIYGDDLPWPADADNGYSLQYVSGDPNLPGSWRSSVDPGGSGVSGYNNWLSRYFPASQHAGQPMSQDDDGDGLNNLGEYAFGTNPLLSGEREHAMASPAAGNPIAFAVIRRAGAADVTYIFETSANLANGAWTAPGNAPDSIVNNGDGTETVTWTAPAAPPGTRIFMRTRVTNP